MNQPSFLHNTIELFEQKGNLPNGFIMAADGKMIAPGLYLDRLEFFESSKVLVVLTAEILQDI
jgi:hypothetical protein